jgi:hypothetical protein
MKTIILVCVTVTTIICLIFLFKIETFTNMAGYYTNQSDCSKMTLKNCLDTSTCAWCMGDNFSPKCVAGQTSDLLKDGKCKKVYANDVFTRALFSGDNDYTDALDLPIVE